MSARLCADLSEYSARHDGAVMLAPSVVRFGPREGQVTLMNREGGGWGEYGITFGSLWSLARRWRVVFVGAGSDQHGRFLRVVPVEKNLKQSLDSHRGLL